MRAQAPPAPRLPLSFAQQRLWFLDQPGGRRRAYNDPAAGAAAGALDVPALEGGARRLIDRHESAAHRLPDVGRAGQEILRLRARAGSA